MRGVRCALAALLLFASCAAWAAVATPGATWAHAPPETLGWSSTKLAAADELARSLPTDSYLVVDGGVLVHEYGTTSRATNVHSVRKSVLSLLIGLYVEKGAFALDRTMADLGITDRGGLTDVERGATIRQLMQARSGIYHLAAYETDSMAAARPPRGSATPGTHYYYNNWDFNALGTIFGKLTGRTVFESLRDDLAGPLQFEDFDVAAHTRFQYAPQSDHPAYVMRLSARDLARVGLLVARNGRWGDRQIVTQRWIAEMLTSYSNTGRTGIGYGYLWWIGLDGWHFGVKFPGKVVSARGHRGQFVVVDMARDIVVVHKVNSELDSKTAVNDRDFGRLLKLIMDAKS